MSTTIVLQDAAGTPLNAKVEITDVGIVLHSRSGKDRNPDYREALETLLRKLDRAGFAYDIYLDSQPVQHLPLERRRLAYTRTAPISERFNLLVRAMNEGSSSHGAWRRLLIRVPGAASSQLATALTGSGGSDPVQRLPAEQLRRVTSKHIHSAVARLLSGEDAPNFAPSRDYDVLTDTGVALAPKKVFGLALEEALGIKAYPGHFSAGWGQVSFELLEAAGLWIVPKSGASAKPQVDASIIDAEVAGLGVTEEERSWVEGNLRMVSHLKRERQPGLAKQKRAEFIATHGKLFCEICKLDPVEKYGAEAGPACIEVHHARVHVADMGEGHVTVTDDLMCLCASCHRVLHRRLALGLGGGLRDGAGA